MKYGFVPLGDFCLDCDCCYNSEHFGHPFIDFGVMHHASASIPIPPMLADISYGFESQMDVFLKKCVRENAKQEYGGYESASYSTCDQTFATAPARCMSLILTVSYADLINSVVLQVDFLLKARPCMLPVA